MLKAGDSTLFNKKACYRGGEGEGVSDTVLLNQVLFESPHSTYVCAYVLNIC